MAAALFEAVGIGDLVRARAILTEHPEAWNRELMVLHYALMLACA